ncbi:MAG: amidohydrolase [Erysipelotrichaceae bacterium]
MILIKNGLLHTMGSMETLVSDLLIKEGKIAAIGKDLSVGPEVQIIDATGKFVYPGMIDGHCHLGMMESAIGFEGNDVNEMSDPLTPHMRAIDGINPVDETIHQAAMAGITTACTGPGSANVIGGTFTTFKTHGTVIDEMILVDNLAMKCAFGENPKRVYQATKIKTRMQTAALLRETLMKTKEYYAKKVAAADDASKLPALDLRLEAMIPVITKQIPLKAHAHRADDIATAIRIAKEFDVRMTLEHCTEGHLIADTVKASGFDVFVGPTLTDKSKFELKNRTFETPARLYEAGVLVSIITDSPVIPLEYLPLCASLAMKAGMPEVEALKAITINPAKALGIDHRVGSLEVGKDADLFISDRHVFDVQHVVEYTLINGAIVHQK